MSADETSEWVERITDISNEEMLAEDLVNADPNRVVAVIRTSDRILFKRCRRRWGWNSHLRQNLAPKQKAAPLWFGSGFHFALEDWHGDQRYGEGRASKAFDAYVRATYKQNPNSLPDDWKDHVPLGRKMLDYYQDVWLSTRSPLQTFIYNGIPQVEVNFRVQIPLDATAWGYDEVVYSGTIDRVTIDEYGQLWALEYKTAKTIATLHYQTDPQVGAYIWALRSLYPGYPVGGVIYQQHLKPLDNPELFDGPRILTSGLVSTAKNMRTTHALYRHTLKKLYGSVGRAPPLNVGYLNTLARSEETEPLHARDAFIRRDAIYRNEHSSDAESIKILMEAEEMLNPNLALYPNPTRDCTFMCPFLSTCVSMDDGSDWEADLAEGFEPRERSYDEWRSYLPGGHNHV